VDAFTVCRPATNNITALQAVFMKVERFAFAKHLTAQRPSCWFKVSP
jgi:hypothetical protein